MEKTKIRTIRLLDPAFCLKCDFAYLATVRMSNGTHKKMFYCSRMDCDNFLNEPKEERDD